jgi:acetate kinase
MSMEDLHTMLHRFSGLTGLSGGIHSMEEILSAVEKGDRVAKNAYNAYLHGIRKQIGASLVILGGVDAIVVSGVQAQKFPRLREDLFEDLGPFGIVLDTGLNAKADGSEDADLSAASSAVKVLYVRRNSGRAIFEEVEKLL